RYQLNYFHTVQTPSAEPPQIQIRVGGPGVAGDTVLIDLGDARPQFWEVFLTPAQVDLMKQNQTYVSIYTQAGVEQIRGNIACAFIGPPPPVPHDADTNGDFTISAEEVNAVFALSGFQGYSCAEDGFQAGTAGGQACDPHDLDYLPQDWII